MGSSRHAKSPFAPVDEVRGFFLTPQLGQRLNLLHHLLRYSQMVLLVTGESGAGKTSLLNQLFEQGDQPRYGCVVDAHLEMTVTELLEKVRIALNLPRTRDGAHVDVAGELKAFLQRLGGSRQFAILALDDAHLLPQDTLDFAMELAGTVPDQALRLLLLGEPPVTTRLHGAGPGRQRLYHVLDIPPLDRDQTAEYVRFQLERAGLLDVCNPDEGLLDNVYRQSRGLPGRINGVARDSLAYCLEETDEPAAEHPKRSRRFQARRTWLAAGAVLGALLATALVSYLLLRPSDRHPTEVPLPLELPAVPNAVQPSYSPVPGKGLPPQTPVQVTPFSPPPLTPVTPGTAPPAISTPPGETPITTPVTASPDEEENPPEPTPIVGQPTPAPSSTSVSAKAPRPKAPEKPSPEPSHAPPKPKQPPEKSSTQATPAGGRSPASVRGEDWLLERNPKHYTVQLTGSHERNAALKFITGHGIQAKAALFHTLHRGRDWYVVVMGDYRDRDGALKGIRGLPKDLRRQGPWARSFQGIHDALNAND